MEQGGASQEPEKPRSIDYYTIKFPINCFVETKSKKGEKIHNYRWPAHEDQTVPKAVVCMFHGYGSYVGKFAFYAKIFQEQGFEVIGMDFKGFGHSEGLRGFIEDRSEFYEEGFDFLVKAREFYQNTYKTVPPIFTMGYSQGGALSLGIARLLHERSLPPLGGQVFIVPNFRIQTDHWTEEFKAELAEKSKDPTQQSPFPAKPLKDWSFLLGYYQDELQFKGPHYSRTLSIVKHVGDEDFAYMPNIVHPVHVTLAEGDNVLDISEIKKFYETIKTPAHLKGFEGYDSDHFILSDGWLYEEVAAKQLKWLNSVLEATKSA